MKLRKVTVDSREKYVSKVSSSQSEYSPENPKPKTVSLYQNQNKNLLQNEKNRNEKKNRGKI